MLSFIYVLWRLAFLPDQTGLLEKAKNLLNLYLKKLNHFIFCRPTEYIRVWLRLQTSYRKLTTGIGFTAKGNAICKFDIL